MAKLDVKQTVEYNGKQYVESKGKAKAGDLILAHAESEDIKPGNFFELYKKDGGLIFDDLGGDNRFYFAHDDTTTLFKVKETFKVGDKVRLLSGGDEFPLYEYFDGEVYEVSVLNEDLEGDAKGVHQSSGRIEITGGGTDRGFALPEQIERVEETKAPEFQVGDKVRLLFGGGDFPLHGYKNGGIYEFDGIRGGEYRITGGEIKNGYATPDQLEKVTVAEPDEQVTDEESDEPKNFDAREERIIKIVEPDSDDDPYAAGDLFYVDHDAFGEGDVFVEIGSKTKLVLEEEYENFSPTMYVEVVDETMNFGNYEIGDILPVIDKMGHGVWALGRGSQPVFLANREFETISVPTEVKENPVEETAGEFAHGEFVLVDDPTKGVFVGKVTDGPRGPLAGGNYLIQVGTNTIKVLGDFISHLR